MEIDTPTSLVCSVVSIDHTNYSYNSCSLCERTLPETTTFSPICRYCNYPATSSPSKRLFRLLISIATDTKVFVVVMFDRAAKILFGCSADDFFDFAMTHPFAGMNAGKVLEGEILKVTLSKPKNGNAQHPRVVSVIPLRSNFKPAIETLREFYNLPQP